MTQDYTGIGLYSVPFLSLVFGYWALGSHATFLNYDVLDLVARKDT